MAHGKDRSNVPTPKWNGTEAYYEKIKKAELSISKATRHLSDVTPYYVKGVRYDMLRADVELGLVFNSIEALKISADRLEEVLEVNKKKMDRWKKHATE